MLVPSGVAAGHPATAEAGIEILAAGGSAADAAVAACLASCVAETVMTGIAGGGHGIWFDAERGEARLLDFFCAVPGLDAEDGTPTTPPHAPSGATPPREPELVHLEVPFGTELVHYAIGIASCAVPGVPAGLEELWRRGGRLPWKRLVAPALRLAAGGVPMPPAHAACLAMLAPVMTMREGRAIYAPRGRLLAAGDRLEQPGLVRTLELVAEEGGRSFYEGALADALLRLMEERGGLVTREDLARYRPAWLDPVEGEYCGVRVLTRAGLNPVLPVLSRVPRLRGAAPAERALALVAALADGAGPTAWRESGRAIGSTTNVSVVDEDGNACVLTTSLGLGSGDFLPGYDVHLNSMLGEADLLAGPLEAGGQMASMMAPTLALHGVSNSHHPTPRPVGRDPAGLVLAGGAAGGTRLRSALVQVVAGILDEGLPPRQAVERPRLHPAGDLVHLEPGFPVEVVEALETRAKVVRLWPERHHYFGGVSVVGERGPAGDPRRSGAGVGFR